MSICFFFAVSSPLSVVAWTNATTGLGVTPFFGAAPELGTKTSISLSFIVEQEEAGARATFSEAYARHFLRFFQNTE